MDEGITSEGDILERRLLISKRKYARKSWKERKV